MKINNSHSFKNKRVLVRVDFNVPLDKNFNVVDDSRIIAAAPTIKKIISRGGKVILVSHLGRPKHFEKRYSLKNIVNHVSSILGLRVKFYEKCVGTGAVRESLRLKAGEVLLLENLRFNPEEAKGDVVFAKKLAELADFYINDAFGVMHRKHASNYVVARYFPQKKFFGNLVVSEIKNLTLLLKKPKKPFTAIIGGAKISGKIDVIESLLNKVDNLIIGGGMAYTFVKSAGGETGISIIEEEKLGLAKSIIEQAKEKGVRLFLPVDSVNATELKNSSKKHVSAINKIKHNHMGLDIGPKSIVLFNKVIASSKTIVWNGPMGVFEMNNFATGTKKIGSAVCEATKNGAFSFVGGGDSVSAIKKFNLTNKVSYISTGGGAMLKYLEGKKLPGIIAIEN